MYELYKEECTNSGRKPVIQTFYQKMFNTQYNFSFFYPKKDQCSVCSLYEQHRIEAIVPEDVEQNYQVHQQRKEESRSDIRIVQKTTNAYMYLPLIWKPFFLFPAV